MIQVGMTRLGNECLLHPPPPLTPINFLSERNIAIPSSRRKLQKDALLSHFAEVAEALSPSTTLITPPPLTIFSSRQNQSCPPNTHSYVSYEGAMHHMV